MNFEVKSRYEHRIRNGLFIFNRFYTDNHNFRRYAKTHGNNGQAMACRYSRQHIPKGLSAMVQRKKSLCNEV